MRYRHSKSGNLYNVIAEATNCSEYACAPGAKSGTEPYVVYQAVESGQTFVRLAKEFHEVVELDGRQVPRFAPVS